MTVFLALLIPPPVDWAPPRAAGPGVFCGHSFTIVVEAGESISQEWPGEMAQSDVYGSYRIETSHGSVVLREEGDRARPRGNAMPVPPRPGVPFSRYDDRVYSISMSDAGNITALSVRFSEDYPASGHLEMLSRVRRGRAPATVCLEPDNR